MRNAFALKAYCLVLAVFFGSVVLVGVLVMHRKTHLPPELMRGERP